MPFSVQCPSCQGKLGHFTDTDYVQHFLQPGCLVVCTYCTVASMVQPDRTLRVLDKQEMAKLSRRQQSAYVSLQQRSRSLSGYEAEIEPPPGYRVKSRHTKTEVSVSENSVIESTYVTTEMGIETSWVDVIPLIVLFAVGVFAGLGLKGLFSLLR